MLWLYYSDLPVFSLVCYISMGWGRVGSRYDKWLQVQIGQVNTVLSDNSQSNTVRNTVLAVG